MFKKLLIAVLAAVTLSTAHAQTSGKPDILEVIEVTGEIGDFTAKVIKEQVDKLNENSKVKAVLLVVDTPGGGATASANAFEELNKVKVPVVAWCSSVCASGGIYIMSAPSVKFVAIRKESIVGSVGVIAIATRYHRLLDWAKIDSETYKSGILKDAWNPTRPPFEEEKKYIQSIIDTLATGFYQVVKDARGDKIKNWDEIKSAKIFIGKQAIDVGLADEIMTFEEASTKAKELSGSKSIFTRQELKKMSQAAEESTRYETPMAPVQMQQGLGDVPALIEIIKEIHKGENVKFQYRMPYAF